MTKKNSSQTPNSKCGFCENVRAKIRQTVTVLVGRKRPTPQPIPTKKS